MNFKDDKAVRVARGMCLSSLKFYIKLIFFVQYRKKFVWNDHHDKIVDALWDVLIGKTTRLIINVAPRYSKTEIVVKAFISFVLGFNPAAKFIHLSYGDAIALDNSETIKDLIESEEYQALFPGVAIKRDSKAKEKWYTNQGGGVLARAAAGQVTGFGAGEVDEETKVDFELMDFADTINSQDVSQFETDLEKILRFAGAIIIDDPIKPEDADQDTIRRKVNSRFDSTIRNRVNSRRTPIILIQQRLHPEDLTGYLLRDKDPDDWKVISLPCLIEAKKGEPGAVEVKLKDDKVKYYRALWSHKHTVEELIEMQAGNELVFGRQYQQDPSPKEGLLFPLEELHFYKFDEITESGVKLRELLDDPDYTLLAADPANEGGDDFAGGTSKVLGDRIYITNILYNTDGADKNEVAIEEMIMGDDRVSTVLIEGVLGWKEVAVRIRERIKDEKVYGKNIYRSEFRILLPTLKKHTRILNRASFIKNHMWFRSDWAQYPQYAKFMRNLISYLRIQEPGKMNKHDDAPDLLEMKADYYEKTFPHLWKPIKK